MVHTGYLPRPDDAEDEDELVYYDGGRCVVCFSGTP